mmetsp:Transcript_81567/g.225907  ORF Transcript_81567/g.225907 Transcript_81567/m.225907 type:complete len:626 (+) Transcript_81567:71-1948(+)
MGMGASCNRWDCALTGDERGPPYLWDCAGQQAGKQWGSSSSREEAGGDATELVASQELEVQLVCDRFAVRKIARSSSLGRASSAEWRRRYTLGRELGAGQTAIVFEAFAAGPGAEELAGAIRAGHTPGQPPRAGRRVALKRFYKAGSLMFKQELLALTAVGVHPHILRLLESYEGGDEDDVLVLEHCDGGDVYDLYAASNGCSMLEAFVLQLIRQLLLAIEYLVERGVEHRDVKPENLLLYGSAVESSTAVPQLKLADFGWAVALEPGKGQPAVPPEGVGSLWYAPPELNPPVEGVNLAGSDVPLGRSDMWSVGIITYLLLIGHSPFNPALRVSEPLARENEVIRLAALGHINMSTRPWACLSDEARDFIRALIQPEAAKRPSPAQAWAHPFMARGHDGHADGACAPPWAPPLDEGRWQRWRRLDGFQRLGWLAFARAVSEPEMLEIPAVQLFLGQQSMGSTMYLDQLAVELALAAAPHWFQPQAAFADILLLAYRYLDNDADGVLSVGDLTQHVVGEDARVSVDCWVSKWRHSGCEAMPMRAVRGLELPEFLRALLESCEGQAPLAAGPQGQDKELSAASDLAKCNGGEGKEKGDIVLQKRMQAIDEVCQRFSDEEFDDFGYGF